MGRPSVHQKSSSRQQGKAAGRKKAPIKVVYISNPMRVTTSAAEFRGLVQKLTGRDSNVADSMAAADPDELSTESAPGSGAAPQRRDPSSDDGAGAVLGEGAATSTPFEVFDDDAFGPQMMESFPGLAQSTLCYEPQEIGGFWRLSEV